LQKGSDTEITEHDVSDSDVGIFDVAMNYQYSVKCHKGDKDFAGDGGSGLFVETAAGVRFA